MDPVQDEQFVVFIRRDPAHTARPDHSEQPLVICPSYEMARRVQKELRHTSRDAVIRYVGPSGGGD
jgi:hypothetical protein